MPSPDWLSGEQVLVRGTAEALVILDFRDGEMERDNGPEPVSTRSQGLCPSAEQLLGRHEAYAHSSYKKPGRPAELPTMWATIDSALREWETFSQTACQKI